MSKIVAAIAAGLAMGLILAAQATAQVSPADAGQHQIEDDYAGWILLVERQSKALFASGRDRRGETFSFEIVPDTLSDVRVVFDDQNGF